MKYSVEISAANKAFQTDEVVVSHLLQKTQKLRHGNFAAEQRRYVLSAATAHTKPNNWQHDQRRKLWELNQVQNQKLNPEI